MKNAAEYSRRIRQLFSKVRKDAGKSHVELPEDPTHIMLVGVLANYASEAKAVAGLERLIAGTVDLNDLRVTPVADLVGLLGPDFPRARPAAEEVVAVLNGIFNQTHDLDLTFLKPMARKASSAFLGALDGASPHALAYFRSRYLGEHVIPLDENMRGCIARLECVPPTASTADIEKFVAGVIKDREASAFYHGLKKYAAVHAPRPSKPKPAAPEPAAPQPAKSPRPQPRAAATGRKAAKASASGGARKARAVARARTGTKRPPTKKK